MFKAALAIGAFITAIFFGRNVAAAGMELSGYYKNLLTHSRTLPLLPGGTTYLLDQNRLRVRANGDLGEHLLYDIQYDNEVLLGNYLDTSQFAFQKSLQPDTKWRLESTYVDNNSVYGTHRLYRAFLTVRQPNVDVRIGRQRIAWGTAILWNPMDILNPFNPVQLERQERQGIDAVLADWNYDALSRLSVVYAKQKSGDSRAVRWRSNFSQIDVSAMLGEFRKDSVAGLDFAGQIGEVGVRGEMTRTHAANGNDFTQGVIGIDYTFPNTLSFNVEGYYNGQGSTDASQYDFLRLMTGKIQSLAKHYVGGYVGYDITPLLQFRNYLIRNLDDASTFLAPSLTYSISDNIEGVIGLQVYGGGNRSEYGTLENITYVQVQSYF